LANALTVAIQGMHNDQTRLDGISRNLANVSTPAYRRETFVSTPFAQTLTSAMDQGVSMTIGVPQVASHVDNRQGAQKFTGLPLDVAIEGDGYYEVAAAGGPAYTRQGRFQVDARGRLTTEAGEAVVGMRGDIVLTGTQPIIDRQGNVTDNGRLVGQLKVVRFPADAEPVRLGNGLLQFSVAGSSDKAVNVRQGFTEASNVSSMTEMVMLVETMRHFESNQRLVQAYDEMLDKALRKLGDL
jgi:flagellar basal-body rod protein FlgG